MYLGVVSRIQSAQIKSVSVEKSFYQNNAIYSISEPSNDLPFVRIGKQFKITASMYLVFDTDVNITDVWHIYQSMATYQSMAMLSKYDNVIKVWQCYQSMTDYQSMTYLLKYDRLSKYDSFIKVWQIIKYGTLSD